MTHAMLTDIRNRYNADMKNLTDSLRQLRENGVGSADVVDSSDNNREIADLQMGITRVRRNLALSNECLDLYQRGEYGCCAECGEEIAPARMKFNPLSTNCFDCQSIAELRR